MIQYIKNKDIDFEKYDACIEKSKNSRIYAYSYYLNIVAVDWDVLILNDYEYVMPIPWRQKYFIKYIYIPNWTQQLGVFSSKIITKDIVDSFIQAIPKKFLKASIYFNSQNPKAIEFSERTNYILPLNFTYQDLFKNYKYVRRRSKHLFEGLDILISSTKNFKQVIKLFIKQKQTELVLKQENYNNLENLLLYMQEHNKVEILVAKTKNEELLGGAFFLKDNNRITYLFSSLSNKGRDEQVMTFIIDSIIEKYANSNLILDFEGSMIPGIAFFFKSFGAHTEIYFNYQKPLFS